MQADFQKLFDLWSEQIPLVNAMAVQLKHGDSPEKWYLEAPLAPNKNHMGTGFGGSIAALATLAGWAQTWLVLPAPEDVHIVVARSTIHYSKPAEGSLIATADAPTDNTIERLLEQLETRGRGSFTLNTHVHSNAAPAAKMEGRFVVSMKHTDDRKTIGA